MGHLRGKGEKKKEIASHSRQVELEEDKWTKRLKYIQQNLQNG